MVTNSNYRGQSNQLDLASRQFSSKVLLPHSVQHFGGKSAVKYRYDAHRPRQSQQSETDEMKNPRTTVLGIITLLGACMSVAHSWAVGQPIDWNAFGIGITAGLGLIHAADGKNGNGNAQPH